MFSFRARRSATGRPFSKTRVLKDNAELSFFTLRQEAFFVTPFFLDGRRKYCPSQGGYFDQERCSFFSDCEFFPRARSPLEIPHPDEYVPSFRSAFCFFPKPREFLFVPIAFRAALSFSEGAYPFLPQLFAAGKNAAGPCPWIVAYFFPPPSSAFPSSPPLLAVVWRLVMVSLAVTVWFATTLAEVSFPRTPIR